MPNVATTLIFAAQQALAAITGGPAKRYVYVVAYLDNFAVDSSTLTDDHRQILDSWIVDDGVSAFPFKASATNHRLVLFAGMASRTGPEENNITLGEQRAQNVYNYLAVGLDASQLDENVQSVGSSRAREGFETPGSEYAENRAVGIVLEIETSIVGVTPPPDPPSPPPPPKSREWEIVVTKAESLGVDPIPFVDVLGIQAIGGTLRNVRTGESRNFRIVAGGISLGVSAAPYDISINTQSEKVTPFNTHWVEFEDFDNTIVVLVGANATGVYDYAAGSIGFLALNTTVEPDGVMFKTNIGIGAQFQYGVFSFDDG